MNNITILVLLLVGNRCRRKGVPGSPRYSRDGASREPFEP